MTKILDKIQRAANLLLRPNQVLDESLEDTLEDAANYLVILIAYLKAKEDRSQFEK